VDVEAAAGLDTVRSVLATRYLHHTWDDSEIRPSELDLEGLLAGTPYLRQVAQTLAAEAAAPGDDAAVAKQAFAMLQQIVWQHRQVPAGENPR